MRIAEYLKQSKVTAKEFPEVTTLSKVHTRLLGDCFVDMVDVSVGVDKLKKAIIYESDIATDELAGMFEYTDRDYLLGPNLEVPRKSMEVLHAVIGLVSESGELGEMLIPTITKGAEVDVPNLREEIGDLLWYIAILLREFDLDLEKLLEENVNKLKLRYPNKYENVAALERKDKYGL